MSGNGSVANTFDLAKQIDEGTLKLRATSMVRFQFSFNIGDKPVGIFGIESTAPGHVALIRRWNHETQTLDPTTGLYHLNKGRQFGHIRPETPLFLVEFTPGFHTVSGRVAFRAGTVRELSAIIEGTPPECRFECVELSDLEILG